MRRRAADQRPGERQARVHLSDREGHALVGAGRDDPFHVLDRGEAHDDRHRGPRALAGGEPDLSELAGSPSGWPLASANPSSNAREWGGSTSMTRHHP